MADPDTTPVDEIVRKVKALCDLEEGLDEWEVNFVEDISHKDAARLTPKQAAKVHELHERHCR